MAHLAALDAVVRRPQQASADTASLVAELGELLDLPLLDSEGRPTAHAVELAEPARRALAQVDDFFVLAEAAAAQAAPTGRVIEMVRPARLAGSGW